MSNFNLDTIPSWCGETVQGARFLGSFPASLQNLTRYCILKIKKTVLPLTWTPSQRIHHSSSPSASPSFQILLGLLWVGGSLQIMSLFFELISPERRDYFSFWLSKLFKPCAIFSSRQNKAQPKHPAAKSRNFLPSSKFSTIQKKQKTSLQPYFSPHQ